MFKDNRLILLLLLRHQHLVWMLKPCTRQTLSLGHDRLSLSTCPPPLSEAD